MGIVFDNSQDDDSHHGQHMERAFQKMPPALPFGVFIAWLRPQPGSSSRLELRKNWLLYLSLVLCSLLQKQILPYGAIYGNLS